MSKEEISFRIRGSKVADVLLSKLISHSFVRVLHFDNTKAATAMAMATLLVGARTTPRTLTLPSIDRGKLRSNLITARGESDVCGLIFAKICKRRATRARTRDTCVASRRLASIFRALYVVLVSPPVRSLT